jgi:hypothetical protein
MSHAPVLGIATPNGNDPLVMERVLSVRRQYAPMEDWVRTSEARGVPSPVMDMLNVTVLVAWDDKDLAPPEEHFRLIDTVHGHRFYSNPRALPRFYLSERIEPVAVLRYEPELVELEYASAAPSMLYSSEAAHPGWKAEMDGRDVPLLLVNGAFRGLAAPPGRHRVTMRYLPTTLLWGGLVSLAAVAGLCFALRRQPGLG